MIKDEKDTDHITLKLDNFKMQHTKCVINKAEMYSDDNKTLSDRFESKVENPLLETFVFTLNETHKPAVFIVYPKITILGNLIDLEGIEVNISCGVNSTVITAPFVNDSSLKNPYD